MSSSRSRPASGTLPTPAADSVATSWPCTTGAAPATIACPVERIGLPAAKEYVAFDFWSGRFLPNFKDVLKADLPGGSCKILAVRPLCEHPQLLSTSRHVTQGMMDVTGENWDAASATLSGSSRVVANDPYELRIVTPAGERSWQVASVGVSPEDQAGGVAAGFKLDGQRLRVKLTSPLSREVRWTVHFNTSHDR